MGGVAITLCQKPESWEEIYDAQDRKSSFRESFLPFWSRLILLIRTAVCRLHSPGSMEDTYWSAIICWQTTRLRSSHRCTRDQSEPVCFGLRDPEPGDIVIFRSPQDLDRDLIKRCVATGGQTVQIMNKMLYVDGQVFKDPPLSKYTDYKTLSATAHSRDNYGPYVVPDGHFFMMGDNRDNSSDSRYWGSVPKELIKGKAMSIYWSWAPDTLALIQWLGSLPRVLGGW